MTTSDPTPAYAPPTNSPNGSTASDRGDNQRRRSRRGRGASGAQDEEGGPGEGVQGSTLERASELLDAVVSRIRRQPYVSVAVAGWIGFVLGGALSFRAGRVVLAAATRHMGRELFKRVQ